MKRFIISTSFNSGPGFQVTRTGNHGKPAGQIMAMMVPSEAIAEKIANALTVWEEAEEELQIKAKHLGELILAVNKMQHHQEGGGERKPMTNITYRLIMHVFDKGDEPPVKQVWEKTEPMQTENVNSLLLQYDDGQLVHNHLFSLWHLKECADGVTIAEYWPYATNVKLGLMKQLPNWGFVHMTQWDAPSQDGTE